MQILLGLKNLKRLSRIISVAQSTAPLKPFEVVKPQCHSYNPVQHCQRLHVQSTLMRYNKKSSEDVDSDTDEDDNAEFKDERDSKVVKAKVNSLRADLLLKAGLGLARNKIENIFYDSKIRVNGQKLHKKSAQLNIGDEIDVIRGFSQANLSHLVIARVIILSANDHDEGLSVHLRRYKSLLVENYAGLNAYKSSEAVNH